MPKFRVTATLPGAGLVQSFVEGARSEADAIGRYRQQIPGAIKRAKKKGLELNLTASQIEEDTVPLASPAVPGEPAPDPAPGPSDSPAAEVSASPPTNVKNVVDTPPLDVLKPFGLSDADVGLLDAAGLQSVEDIVAYAKAHSGLTSIDGVTPEVQRRVKSAITASRQGGTNGN